MGSTTTGGAGSNATVTNVGTSTNAVLNFTIPQGAQGTQGLQGTTGPGYYATSTSAQTIGTGSKIFTTQAGLAYVAGDRVRAIAAAPTNYVEGNVASYGGTTLVLNVDTSNGSGSSNAWTFSIAGTPGTAGSNGTNGTNGTNGAGFSPGSTGGQVYLTGAGGAVPTTPKTTSGDVIFNATGDGSTTIQANAVTTAKIAASSVTVAKISASGTPSSTTFLRGDGLWTAPAGGTGTGAAPDGIPYGINGHNWNTSLLYWSPSSSGQTTTAPSGLSTAIVPTTCNPTATIYSYGASGYAVTLETVTFPGNSNTGADGTTLGICTTTSAVGSAFSCTIAATSVPAGTAITIKSAASANVQSAAVAFSCQ